MIGKKISFTISNQCESDDDQQVDGKKTCKKERFLSNMQKSHHRFRTVCFHR